MELPKYRETTDVEKFVYGFKEILKETNWESIIHTQEGAIVQFKFKDGTRIGARALLEELGLGNSKILP